MEIIDATDRMSYVIDGKSKYKVVFKARGEEISLKCSCPIFSAIKNCRHCDLFRERSPGKYKDGPVIEFNEWEGTSVKSIMKFISEVGY